MTTYAITRHPAAIAWLQQQGVSVDEKLTHLTDRQIAVLQPGDRVVGTLPVQMIAKVCAKGAEYWHLTLNLTPELRAKGELDLADMNAAETRLEAYFAKAVSTLR